MSYSLFDGYVLRGRLSSCQIHLSLDSVYHLKSVI